MIMNTKFLLDSGNDQEILAQKEQFIIDHLKEIVYKLSEICGESIKCDLEYIQSKTLLFDFTVILPND